jgi:desulfoferrodoxin (superoxide reductase-like protein)
LIHHSTSALQGTNDAFLHGTSAMSDRVQNRREFLAQSSAITSAMALPAVLSSCASDDESRVQSNPEWEEIADGLEQNPRCCWTGDPAQTDSPSVGAHLPQISIDTVDGRLVATVFTFGDEDNTGQLRPHPMTAQHWLTTMYVRDDQNVVIALRDFGRAAIFQEFVNIDPRVTFDVPPGTKWLRGFSFCNLHQHWRGPKVDIEGA